MIARYLCLQLVRSIQVTLDRLFIWVANQQWDIDIISGFFVKDVPTFLRKSFSVEGIHCVLPIYLMISERRKKMIQEFLELVSFCLACQRSSVDDKLLTQLCLKQTVPGKDGGGCHGRPFSHG